MKKYLKLSSRPTYCLEQVISIILYLVFAIMAGLKVGDTFPDGIEFSYVPWSPETASPEACGMPIPYKASEEFKDKVGRSLDRY